MAGKRKHKVPGKIRHAEHEHPQTRHYSVLCRKNMIETGQPLSVLPEQEMAVETPVIKEDQPLTRGQKAAATRARNKAAAEQAQAIDAVLDLTETAPASWTGDEVSDDIVPDLTGARHPMAEVAHTPLRNSSGRFTRNTLEQWDRLLSSIEGAETYLFNEGAELVQATLTTKVAGVKFLATFDGDEWSVEVAE